MKILKLVAENVKKLRAVEITPTGDLVEITGPNGSGKTSILDSIFWALAGTKHIQAAPIRKGQNKARIQLDLGELIVERRFTAKGSTLTVESAEGAQFRSPQGVLDALLGALSFDPLEFVGQEAREQFETLRGIVPLEVDLDKLDGLNRGDYDRRTELSREAKTLRAQAEGIAVAPDLPVAPINTAALLERMADAAKMNAEIETRRGHRETAETRISDLRAGALGIHDRILALLEEIKSLNSQADAKESEAAQLQAKLDAAEPLPEPVDVDALRGELETAQDINKLVDQAARKDHVAGEAADREAQARALTEAMEAREQVKADAIAKAPMPVAGLGFGDGIVLFGGIPFDQASTAEQLRVSLAIAMAANPKLKVIRIKEGGLLDADNMALIAEMAKVHGFQVWIETISSSGRPAIEIADGQVVAVDGEPVTEQPQPEPERTTVTGRTEPDPGPPPGRVNPAPKPRPSSPW